MISRDLRAAGKQHYDVCVVGGGIQGAALTLEAARCGLRVLLVEKHDFGSGVSWNSLRVVHGGLRYLQKVDWRRYRESVAERKWFFTHFPDLVRPIDCLMPLYNRGVYRRSVFRAALTLNDLMSKRRNRGVREDRALARGRVLSRSATLKRFPMVREHGLKGAALWRDGFMPDSHRVIIEMLHWAAASGAACINYCEAEELVTSGGRVVGISARDRLNGETITFQVDSVINCAGPAVRCLSEKLDRDLPRLFYPLMAFNLFIDREPLADCAVAIRPDDKKGAFLFLCPWKGRILAGTHYARWDSYEATTAPQSERIAHLLRSIEESVPGLTLSPREVKQVLWGLLPAASEESASPADRPVLLDHRVGGGPEGLFSVSGVKFTTARSTAEKAISMYRSWSGHDLGEKAVAPLRPKPQVRPDLEAMLKLVRTDLPASNRMVADWIQAESVVCENDLLFRRTDWAMDPGWSSEHLEILRTLPAWQSLEADGHL